MSNAPDKILIDFVEGRLDSVRFEQILYDNEALEHFLKSEPRLPLNHYVKGDVYTYLIRLDYQDVGDLVNAFGAVSEFLERKQIAFNPTSYYQELFSIILSAQPTWLGANTAYISKLVLSQTDTLKGDELKIWLKKQLSEKFRYVDKPPRWLQSPNWLFGEREPLIFLGQLSLKNFFHDEAAVYVFYDAEKKCCETVVQVC